MGINSKIEKTKGELVNAVNASGLPASIIDLIMSNMLVEIRAAAKQQLAEEQQAIAAPQAATKNHLTEGKSNE